MDKILAHRAVPPGSSGIYGITENYNQIDIRSLLFSRI